MISDTIFALSTPPGRGGVAVVRVSGPQSWASAALLGAAPLRARQAGLHRLRDPLTGETIDHALVLPFQGPASFTGEDVVEYHVHGGRAVVDSLLSALAAQEGHRQAEPGEFTRRAFENGKLDLTEAEAVADLIDAETQAQKAQALAQMDGALSRLYHGWAERLTHALAHLEADIEFPDEDLPQGIFPQVRPVIEGLRAEIAAHLDDNRRGERLREGIRVAVIGAPNAGKSSLVNALARRDVAIVSDIAGTTRDVIEVHLDLGGYPVILADTAGLRPDQIGRDGQEGIEAEGIRRALQQAREADIRLLVFDGTASAPDAHTLDLRDERALAVMNKSDRHPERSEGPGPGYPSASPQEDALWVSARTGEGLDGLIAALVERAGKLAGRSETPALTRRRHRSALEDARSALLRSLAAPLPELAAEDVRLSVRALGRITGKVDVEDLLDVIFRDFCIGK
ncbi:MAG: tRNA uridine-5-carboxymethylaminomethyl(34) synthesis GTPase MnmE [Alphaproteobacteria bacterium]|nr:tRNA uridine-5-carboxymethylaminomethyl(34) synthesis GTPase MnmE [Alphaproteobacteria bacterium]